MVKSSFTIIELMVVTTVILLLSTFSFAWYQNSTIDKVLSQVELQLKNALETAKVSAASGNTSLCTNKTTAYLTTFSVVIMPNGIQLHPYCDTVPTLITLPLDHRVVFAVPSQEVMFDHQGHTSCRCISFTYSGSTRSRAIKVNTGGLITSEPACSCP